MSYRQLHPYAQAHIMAQRKPAKNNFTEYINISTSQTLSSKEGILDYLEERHDGDDEVRIFIGNKTDCIVATIQDDKPTQADLKIFKKYTIADMDYNSMTNQNTLLFIKAVLRHFQRVLNIERVIIFDEPVLYIDINTCVNLNDIYFLRYQRGYYTKNWCFLHCDNKDRIKQQQDIYRLSNDRCDKTLITTAMYKKFYNKPVNKFLVKMTDNELVTDFVNRYETSNTEIELYIYFINLKSYNNSNTLLYAQLL